MYFPTRDLTDQYISTSYQDVVQQYVNTSSTVYFLDGYGYSIFGIPSSSVGQTVLTQDQTASWAHSSSFAISASWASFSNVSYIADIAFLADTASIAVQSETSSFLFGGATIIGGLQFDTASSVEVNQEGYVFWDNDAKTLAIKPDITASTLQVGQEMWIRYVAGENITNGDAIYIGGAETVDGHPICYRSIADGTRTKFGVIAIATNDAASGSHNFATSNGTVHDLDTSTYVPGLPLFLSSTLPGKYSNILPPEPYERVLVGYGVGSGIGGSIYVGIVGIPDVFRAFVGTTILPSITDNSNGTITIGTGSVALNTLASGKGTTRVWQINSASFAIPIGLTDVNYIIADYNGGTPIWAYASSSLQVDNIQKSVVYSVNRAFGQNISYTSWDEPGILLANKVMSRIIEVHGVENGSGMVLGESGSRFVVVTSGSFWVGASRNVSAAYNSTSSGLFLLYHSGSTDYTASLISQYENLQYDNGTGLSPLLPNKFVVNYVYKSATTQNRCLIMLSNTYGKLVDAQADTPPPVPGDLLEGGILVGRAIYESGLPTATQIDSAFTTQFTPSYNLYHNDLLGLQGGSVGEYYHLTSASYAQVTSGTASYAVSSSTVYPIITNVNNYTITSGDYTIIMSGSTNLTASLPSAVSNRGKVFNIKNVTLTTASISGSQKIDADDFRLLYQWDKITLQSDGGQWLTI